MYVPSLLFPISRIQKMGVHEEKVKGAYIYGQNDNGLIKRPIRDLNSLVEKKGT